MALNYSHRPIFPSHTSENMVSPTNILNGYVESISEKKGECYSRSWHASQGEADDWNFNCGTEEFNHCTSPDSTSKDIVDLLPSDPFGMDIKTTFTAITGWLEDLEVGYARADQEDYSLFPGWNFFWNSNLKFQPFPSCVQSFSTNFQVYEKQNVGSHSFSTNIPSEEKLNVKLNHDFAGDVGNIDGFGNGSSSCSSELQIVEKVNGALNSDGSPHEAFAFTLGFLGVKDLLSVERVCKSLCSTVRGDPLLWMNIHIDQPLNEKITDDALVQLANRTQGKLQCLSLVECPRVTDDGIKRILESNSRLTKLSVPGCSRLSSEGIVSNIKTHNYNINVQGIKHLRIGGLYGITQEHYEELTLLLGADRYKLKSQHKPHFYHKGNFYLPYNDDRVIDIEMCPICEKFRLVYDCPAKSCRDKEKGSVACRGCTLCIPRCAQCGRCVNDTEYEETFCLELLCSDCFKQLVECQSKLDEKGDACGAMHEVSYSFTRHG